MANLVVPKQVGFSELQKKGFSPRNFRVVGIPREEVSELRYFLNQETPYVRGIEPGSSSYVAKSNTSFIRNSCIDSANFTPDDSKTLYLNPNLELSSMVSTGDILLCKDANIGESCLFLQSDLSEHICFSSGMVKLNFLDPASKYYLLAAIRDSYFLEQLDAITPKGSTIRHSGDLFLKCRIPKLGQSEKWVYEIFEILIKNITHAEIACNKKISAGVELIESVLLRKSIPYSHPRVTDLAREERFDAGFYSEVVQNIHGNISAYEGGCESLSEFGYAIRRGPNLAKRDLGRSIISDDYRDGYDVLIYPSDISDRGFVLRNFFIGARGAIWHLGIGDILFSAEGTVGRVFAICDNRMRFTTNFHGIIISPVGQTSIDKSAFLAMYLHFLRSKGYFDKVSVGGQGGSFASSYWGLVRLPKVPASLFQPVAALYFRSGLELDPFKFEPERLQQAGIYQLSALRMRCNALLAAMMTDIKGAQLQQYKHYEGLGL